MNGPMAMYSVRCMMIVCVIVSDAHFRVLLTEHVLVVDLLFRFCAEFSVADCLSLPVRFGSPKGATSFPDWGSYEYDQIRVSLFLFVVFIVFSCLGLLSCIELCIFLCHLVLFVSTLAKWLAGKTYSRYIFCVKRVPLQRPYWRVIYWNASFYVFPTHNF